MRLGIAFAFALTTSLLTLTASANGGGVAGYTGKPTATSPQGQSCNQCHNGGATPQVSITGPASLAAGQSAEYSLVVATGQARAAGAIAGSDGAVLAPLAGGGLRDSFGEMVQDGSRAVAGGQAAFRFRVTAPMTGTTLKLWAVGLAANGNGTGGDRAAHATRDITVTGGGGSTPPPDPGSSSSSGGAPPDDEADGGAPDPSNPTSGTKSSSGNPAGDSDDEAEDDVDDTSTGSTRSRRRRMASADQGVACGMAPAGGSSLTVLGVAAAVALGLVARRRRSS
ncbi:MAG: hypothetical protein KF764_00040 [Labilithrix sp.]|nr:hypothetical protein [Labilithrix sp.]